MRYSSVLGCIVSILSACSAVAEVKPLRLKLPTANIGLVEGKPEKFYMYVNRTIELWSVADGRRLARWRAGAKNPWHPTGTAVLAVGFGTYAGTYYALLGDGRIAQLSGTS